MKIIHFFLVIALGITSNIFASNANQLSQGRSIQLAEGEYVPNTLNIKIKREFSGSCAENSIAVTSISSKLSQIKVQSVSKRFPKATSPIMERNVTGNKFTDLSLIYKITYASEMAIEDVISFLRTDEAIEYVEPDYLNYFCYTPNEPSTNLALQYFLNNIQAYAAWDVWKGDTNTVIGIVDSGTDWDHPDLTNNIKYNYADPINGTDDDNDGFTDNFRGWDVSDNDNDPMVGNSSHGSHVSGCAAASTDNGIGVASPGFRCKFLPVKSSLNTSTTSIDNGYDGIVYAADHGVKVINLSWGRGGGASEFEQDIITYAAINKDVTVVAAAGNNSAEQLFYPASYLYVLNVASTNSSDAKSSFSNYGGSIDVCAPGSGIYSTIFNNTYNFSDGTSMASPIAAGGAALVRSRFPSFNALQAAEQLKATCDNIYGVSGNSGYSNKLGSGRINLFRALTDTTTPGISIDLVSVIDGNDNAFIINDTLSITALFTNLLRPGSNLTATLTAQSTAVTVLTPMNAFAIGSLGTLDTVSNWTVPFRVRIRPTAPVNSVVPFKITVTDGTYSTFYAFSITVNVDYINVEINDISTSITSKGRIGYNVSGASQGLGFLYQGGPTNLYEMGLMIGDGTHQVADGVRNAGTVNNGYDDDFRSLQNVREIPSALSDFYSEGVFDESGPTTISNNKLNVSVRHKSYAWDTNPDRKYVIVEFIIKNIGTSSLSNLYAGIFSDWDVPQYANNKADEDLSRKMGYSYSTDPGGLYCGIKLLTNTAGFFHYALDNVAGGNGGIDMVGGGFDETEKYQALSSNRPQAGGTASTGNDVIEVVSTGPYSIPVNDSVTVAFALIAGENLPSIQASADAAQIKYDNLFLGLTNNLILDNIVSIYPNPAKGTLQVSVNNHRSINLELSVQSVQGGIVRNLFSGNVPGGSSVLTMDICDLAPGSYLVHIKSDNLVQAQLLQVIK